MVRRRSDRGRLYTAFAAITLIAVLVGVGSGTDWYGLGPSSSLRGCPAAVTLQGAGASFPAALVTEWVSQYSAASSNFVNYATSGAGAGITLLTEKQVDFALTDEPLSTAESSVLLAAVGTVLTLPVTGGAVALIYDLPGYSGRLNLTPNQLAGIYNGSISAWNDPALVANNPSLVSASASIFPVHRNDQAGMSFVLTNLLSEDNAAWATSVGTSVQPVWPTFGDAIGETGNKALITAVAGQTGAIGYTDLYDAESHGIPSAYVRDARGQYVAPSPLSATSAVDDVYNASPGSFPPSNGDWANVSFVNGPGAGDYPLATLVYALVPENPALGHTASPAEAAVLVQWLNWTLTSGESFNATQFPYVNPPGPLVTQARSALSSMDYGGATIPRCP